MDQHRQFHGWLLFEAAMAIVTMVGSLRDDRNFVVNDS
jgi:hypothetical protein